MDLVAHFQMLAKYNRIANERLYAACAQLDTAELKKHRNGSFGSIHALLNHVLLADRIWMSRFIGEGSTTPPLNTVLFEDFSELHDARKAQDEAIERFFSGIGPEFFTHSLHYANSRGIPYEETASVATSHFFNHQTHHRGQVHIMLSQTTVAPPSLDLHRIIHP